MKPSPFIILTGLSGSGKGTFLRALEDRGYFCVDNLPVALLGKFSELVLKSEGDVHRAALVVDVREGQRLREFPALFEELRRTDGLDPALYFLEASNEALIRRFSETRRPHPLDANLPVREAIQFERERLLPIREMSDQIVDTSSFSIHELRSYVDRLFDDQEDTGLLLTLVSFGFKYGIPVDSDMIFDARFLPNPYFVPELKNLTGSDAPVVNYMRSQEVTGAFLGRLGSMLDFLLPHFKREGKSYLTVGIGCTGGRHRSVMLANALAASLTDTGLKTKVTHRDVDKR
jgi:UPF0042 nucleotide-binding protein